MGCCRFLPALLIGLACLAWCQPALGQPYGFDYLLLARQWGPTFCETNRCSQNTYNLMTIHGLWPNNKNGSHPADCDKTNRFNKDALPIALLGPMSCEWRSFTGSNEDFWAYEWSKHGTCGLPLFKNQTAYFGAAIRLNNQYDINEALVQAGVNPLSATAITKDQVTGILKKAWNVTVQVTCSNGNLNEVRMCFDTSLKPINCPGGGSCPKGALNMPYGGSIPMQCKSYFEEIPPAGNINASPPSPPRSKAPPAPKSAATHSTASLGLMLLAAAAAAVAAAAL